MKKIDLDKLEHLKGGITAKDCINLGAFFAGFVLTGELELAVGSFGAALSGGCFEN